MITFASLFLGLIVGIHPVQVLVDGPVASVELHLDGRSIARLEGAPWQALADFGRELAPHELEAVAFGADGAELHRTRQWINLARPPAEAHLLLEGGEDGRGVRARLTWESVAGERPTSGRVELDGRELQVDSFESFELPDHDPRQLHFLRVELHFSEYVSSVVELTFGGTFADQVSTQQTAIPVYKRTRKAPSVGNLQGRFSKDGAPLRVLAVDEGPVEIVVVRDPSAQRDLDNQIRNHHLKTMRAIRRNSSASALQTSIRHLGKLGREHRVRFLSPYPERRERPGFAFELFPPSAEFTHEDGGLVWLLASVRPVETARIQRLSDAVAVAGILASSRDRRRAVVLLLGGDPEDRSQLDFASARAFLEKLRVPLFVWSTRPEDTDRRDWGEAADVSNMDKLAREMKELRRHLDRQRIVWLEGYHLPQRVELSARSEAADDLAL